jgi:hypothetical protein
MKMVLPDYATRFDSLSLTACFIALKGVGDAERQATGFFWRRADKVFLITNWHVVTGLNMMSGKPVGNGWCPEKLMVQYFTKTILADSTAAVMGPNTRTAECPTLEISLYENFHRPFWLQHPDTFDLSVDIVAIEISNALSGNGQIQCVNDYEYPRLYHFSGSEIFVLGHPLPKTGNAYPVSFPVWKRGSIASEIIVPWNMRPAFLIDSRTSRGMSGSPVFSRVFGPAAFGDGTIKTESILISEFMGVYSGRIFDDENNASIGLVWHRTLIDQILDASTAGSRDWKPSPVGNIFSNLKDRS